MSVLAAIAVILLLIAVHELGHFLAARLQGIHVNRFSIGFGPILWKYQGSKTEYAIRAIPLGGYVGFPDDDPESTIPDNDPDLLRNRPVLDRAIVISAGVIANLIFAYLVLVLQVGCMGILSGYTEPGILVPEVISAESPAARAGIRAGDVIVAVGDTTLSTSQENVTQFKDIIESNPDRALSLSVERNGRQETLEVTPKADSSGLGRIGVQLIPNGDPIYRRPDDIVDVFQMFGLGAEHFHTIFVETAGGFYKLITNFGDTASQLASPVKIVQQGSEVAKDDALNLLLFGAIISINLAIINILPLPALDGGQLAFLIVEGLRGKPVPVHIQDGFMQSGMLVLLGLGVFLIVRDTTQLEWVQQLME